MTRLLSAMKTDATVQVRNNLYAIGIGVGIFVAILISQLARPSYLPDVIPSLMLLIVGGSTLLYVAGMIIFEKDEGTLSATIVSPLRTSEYLWSKVLTLTGLATLEAIIMVGGAMLILSWTGAHEGGVAVPNVPLLLLGIIAICIMYTLMGIVLVVRYSSITDFLIPMSAVGALLQIPFIYTLGWVDQPIFLAIPTTAPTLLMKGAFLPLAPWEWAYAIGYTIFALAVLTVWAYRAFQAHIVMKVG